MNISKAAKDFARASRACEKSGIGTTIWLFTDGQAVESRDKPGRLFEDGHQEWPIARTKIPIGQAAAREIITAALAR